jgi:hypothetical protein
VQDVLEVLEVLDFFLHFDPFARRLAVPFCLHCCLYLKTLRRW